MNCTPLHLEERLEALADGDFHWRQPMTALPAGVKPLCWKQITFGRFHRSPYTRDCDEHS